MLPREKISVEAEENKAIYPQPRWKMGSANRLSAVAHATDGRPPVRGSPVAAVAAELVGEGGVPILPAVFRHQWDC
jgi:hypothetical protein